MNRDGPRASLVAAIGAAIVVDADPGRDPTGRGHVAVRRHRACSCCSRAASLLGIRINFLDFVALPITIGIGIDYSVNIAARHRSEGRGSAARILAAAGPAVALCSFTTVVGYASLLFSANQGIRSFGLAALIGEVTCIGAAIALAPALLDFGLRRRPSLLEVPGILVGPMKILFIGGTGNISSTISACWRRRGTRCTC